MKTVLTQAIEQIQTKAKEYDGMDNAFTCFAECVLILTQYLPSEREQIEQAYRDGYSDRETHRQYNKYYFTQTYKQ